MKREEEGYLCIGTWAAPEMVTCMPVLPWLEESAERS